MNDDRSTLLIVFGIAVGAVAAWLTAAGILRRRRARSEIASMRPMPRDALTTDVLLNGARQFYEGRSLPDLRAVKRHLKRLTGAVLLSEVRTPGGSVIWNIRFKYREYEFEIEMNYHGACSVYFVNDPASSDEILIKVADHFDRQLY
jgi:hypothetical protein